MCVCGVYMYIHVHMHTHTRMCMYTYLYTSHIQTHEEISIKTLILNLNPKH